MPADSNASPDRIRADNERYHDAAASGYDAKWGIDFGGIGRDQTRQKFTKALGGFPEQPFGDALEIGCGTGYLSLNLMRQDAIRRLKATDVSTGMLNEIARNAADLGLDDRLTTIQAEAESLPVADESVDLVLGHAVLHHIPDLARAFAEMRRVLRPGGTIVFCGEPSRHGDRIATVPKRAGALAAPAWRALMRADQRQNGDAGDRTSDAADHGLEGAVDVHAFDPAELERMLSIAGFGSIRVQGEELLANMYGWWLRSLEATAKPDQVPVAWRHFAFRSYLALQRVDTALLEPHLPANLFYNLVLSAKNP